MRKYLILDNKEKLYFNKQEKAFIYIHKRILSKRKVNIKYVEKDKNIFKIQNENDYLDLLDKTFNYES